jgi:tetratricopeptide (TPR) repeat protein
MPHVLQRLASAVRQHPGRAVASAALLVAVGLAAVVVLWPVYHYQAAQRALQRRDLESAQRHLEACLRAWPWSASIHFQAARTARRRDALAEARRHLTTCQRLQGATPASALEWMLLRTQEGELDHFENDLQSLVQQHHPDQVLILEALARGYQTALRLPEFLHTVDLLLELQPDHFQAHFWRGQVAESLGRPEDALGSFQKAVDLNPQAVEARLRLALTLEQLGHPRKALAHYEYLRQRQPDNPEVLLGLAHCRRDAHELAEAGQLLDELLKAHPDMVPALVERGRVAFLLESIEAAEVWLRRAVTCGPHDREAHRLLLVYLEAQGKTDAASQCRAALQQIEGDIARSSALMFQVVDAPHDAALRSEVGILLLRLGQEEEGLHWLATALEEDPGHTPTHNALADYYERTGQPERAALHRGQGDRGTAP